MISEWHQRSKGHSYCSSDLFWKFCQNSPFNLPQLFFRPTCSLNEESRCVKRCTRVLFWAFRLNAVLLSFKATFLWGDPNPDQWSKICLDHGASKEPANPLWSWIHGFLWCTMIQTDLASLIRIRITPKECSLNFKNSSKIHVQLSFKFYITNKHRK